jgi:hypothetical protein
MSDATDLDARMQAAVSAGLREVLADDELMDRVLDRLLQRIQRGAAERTGRWLWNSLRVLFSRWLVIAAIVLAVGQMIGWGPAKTVLGWLTGPKP